MTTTMSSATSATAAPATRTSTAVHALFGLGQVAGQIFRDVPSLLLLFFMTNTLGIAPATAGVAIFVPKFVWGSLCDLAVGAASDALAPRLARRHWLLGGALFAPLAMVLLFHVPAGTPDERTLYLALMFTLYMAVFALFSVPYLAIGTMLAGDEHGRTAVMAWRLVFTAVGILLAAAIGPMLLQRWGGGEPAYRRLALLLALVCSLCLVAAWVAARRGGSATPSAPPSLRAFWQALRGPRLLHLIGPVGLQLVGSGLSYAAMVYFISDNLGRSDPFVQLGVMILLMTGGIAVAQPAWLALSRRIGKPRSYLLATALYGLTLGLWGSFDAATPIQASYAMALALAVFNSGWALMSFSMLSDVIADDAAAQGADRGGVYSALWVAADKIGFALGGTLLVGLLLSAFGFDSAKAVAGVAQAERARTGIALAFGFVPALLNALAIGWFALAQRRR